MSELQAERLTAIVIVQESGDALVGASGTSTRQVKTDAPFWQSKYLFNCPLSAGDARVAPKIEFASSRKLLLRGLSFHEAFLG
jgi:hypothetical protein